MRILLALLLCLPLPSQAASSIRCDSRLVTVGDWDFTLSERCGEPYHVDRWNELHSVQTGPQSALSKLVQFEDWFYDFGTDRLLVRVRLRDGQLVDVDTLTRRGRLAPERDCDATAVLRGLSSGELVSLCGPPARRDPLPEAIHYGSSPAETVLPLRRERWFYDNADERGLIVWIDAGRVSRVERPRR